MTQDKELTPEQIAATLGATTPEVKEFFEITSTLASAVAHASFYLSKMTGTDAVAWSEYLLRTGHMRAQELSLNEHLANQMRAIDEFARLATKIPTPEDLDNHFKLHCVPPVKP